MEDSSTKVQNLILGHSASPPSKKMLNLSNDVYKNIRLNILAMSEL